MSDIEIIIIDKNKKNYHFSHLEDGRIILSEVRLVDDREEFFPLGYYLPLIDTRPCRGGMSYSLTPLSREESDRLTRKTEKHIPQDHIPQKNLEKMLGTSQGEMTELLMHETLGGNAGHFMGRPCYGARFYYDRGTGEIFKFSNHPIGDTRLYYGLFRLAVRPKFDGLEIIEFRPEIEPSAHARINIQESMKLYNKRTKK